MKKTLLTFAVVVFTLVSVVADDETNAKHQVGVRIPEVVLLDIEDAGENGGAVNLAPDISELEAGDAIDFSNVTDNNLWLNYTSVVAGNGNNGNSGKKRKVSVKIENGNLPGGISLLLEVGDADSGNGKLGKAISGKIKLDNNEKDIIKNIGSGYTGSGKQKGHQLTYSLEMDNSAYNELIAKSYTTQILYTITDK